MGKTRLAMAIASELPADRVRWVDLIGKKSEEDVALAVLFALGSREGEDLESILHRTLQQQHSLVLFLDNCEEACAVLAAMVDQFLRTSPELVVVATSRVALRLSYESMIEVGPIESLEDACALFEQRAMARRGPFTAAERPLAAKIVSRLEHIPLAIELAAARTGTLSLEDLGRRLEHDLSLLADRARDRPERQRDFVAAVSSTFHLLEPASRAALARLALFRGGFDLAGVEAVLKSAAGESPSALESREAAAAIVDDLAQASLIYRLDVEGLARFRMYECLRQCAIEALSVSEQAVTVERIAAFLAETGSSLSDWTVSLDEQRIRALRADLENYRSLWTQTQEQPPLVRCFVQLGCVLGSIYLAEGPLVESQRVLTRTVELARPQRASIPDSLWGELLWKRGHLRAVARDVSARADLEEALECFAPAAQGPVLRALSNFECESGNAAAALRQAERALALAESSGDSAETTLSLYQLAMAQKALLDCPAALRSIDRAIEIEEATYPGVTAAMYHALRGGILLELGEFVAADEALAVAVAAVSARKVRIYTGRFCAQQALCRFEAGLDSCCEPLAVAANILSPENDLAWCITLKVIAAVRMRDDAPLCEARALQKRARGLLEQTTSAILALGTQLLRAHAGERCAPLDLPPTVCADERVRSLARLARAAVVLEPELLIAEDGAFFDWRGQRVELSRRPLLRRILAALVAGNATGRTHVSRTQLVAEAWPGERLIPESAFNRLRVAVSELRSLGLRDVLTATADGYALTASAPIRLVRPS